jgi:hypothetical protein
MPTRVHSLKRSRSSSATAAPANRVCGEVVAEARYSHSPHRRSPNFHFDFGAAVSAVKVMYRRPPVHPSCAISISLRTGVTKIERPVLILQEKMATA